jgi:dihydroorotate dehydrogenase
MDLTTNYLGLSLRSPLVPSASPLSEKIENVRTMEQAGAAAVVFHSLFEEQIEATAPEFRVDPKTYLERTSRTPNTPSAFQSSAV